MTQMSVLVTDARGPRVVCPAGGFPDGMRELRKMPTVSDLRLIDITELRIQLAEQVKLTYEENAITVVAWFDRPEGVLMSMEYWNLGRERQPVEDMLVERIGTREVRPRLRVLGGELRRGKHTIMTVWRDDRAAFAPYEWARRAFPEWDLPEVLKDPPGGKRPDGECVQVVYRKSRTAQQLLAEFAEAQDPEWEVDRRLSGGRAPIPVDRRPRLRGVVYVEDGVVVRVRAVDPDGVWENVSERVCLAPVSAPLTAQQVEERLPSLRVYPGDQRLAPQGSPREYIDL